MTLFEKNLKALGKNNPVLLSYLAEKYENNIEQNVYKWQKNISNENIVFVDKRRIGSCYSNQNLIQQWISQYELANASICLFGMAIYEVFLKIAKYLKEGEKVFIYEPDPELFLQFIERVDISSSLEYENIYLSIGKEGQEHIFQQLDMFFVDYQPERDHFCTMYLPGYNEIYSKESQWFDERVFQWLYFKEQNLLTTRRFFRQDIEKPLERIQYYRNAIIVERLKENWDIHMPVIVVAAGPSLRKNIGELKRAKGHALIVAVARAVLYLKEEKIVPDIIVDIDETNAYATVDEEYRKVPIMCSSCIGEKTFYWNQGPKIMILDKPFLQHIKKEVGFPSANYEYYGSCAIAAFSTFAMLGAEQIVLVGQDLAFGEDGSSHAEGVREDIAADQLLPGYYGGMVQSRPDWYGFWCWYERTIKTLENCKVINATEGGAAVPDTLQIPLKEVVDKIQDFQVDMSFLEEKEYRVSEAEYEYMLACLQKAKQQFREVSKWSSKDYHEKKKQLEETMFYPILKECMYVSEEEKEWIRFQKAIEYMSFHGWRN